jgi:integrase
MARVYRPEASYYLRFTQNGKLCLEPAGKDPGDVLTFIKVRRALLTNGDRPAPREPEPETPGRVTIRAASDAYLDRLIKDKRHEPTIKSKRYELGEFAKFCKRRFVDEITHDDLVDYREHLFACKKSDVTVYNKLITVVTWLKHNPLFPVRGLLKYPDDYPTLEDTVPEPYTAAEVALLKKHATPRERLILQFFLSTGMREQEVAHCEFRDLNLDTRTVRVQKKPHYNWKPKSAAGTRSIPISSALLAELSATQAGLQVCCSRYWWRYRAPLAAYVQGPRKAGRSLTS